MRFTRLTITGLAAAALIVAGGCKSTTRTTTSANGETTTVSSTTTPAVTPAAIDNGTSGSTTTSTTYTAPSSMASMNSSSTTTGNDGSTTTTLPNGSTVTRSETTTIVYPNGTVQTIPNNGTASTSMTSANGTETTQSASNGTSTSSLPNIPPGAAIVTKTTTTITTKTSSAAPQSIAYAQPQPIYVTTTPANVYVQPQPMTSSSTTVYQPYTPTRGRRFPGTNFLIFADRASFSNSNSALSGTLNTGTLGSDISHENGYGIGFNKYLGRTNFSTEFTASMIRPRATLTPANATFNPITNFRFRMEPVTGTLQLHMNPRSSVDFYVGGGGAWVHFSPDSSFNAGNTGLTSVHFKNEWGPLVNAGLGFGFSPNFGINFDAKYMWVRAKATTTFNNVTIGNVGNSERIGVNPFILSAGLRFGF